MYELFIENFKVDIDQKLSVQLTFAIDDIANYGSRETSFSKTIVLPGTGRNNQIFGFIYDIASFNFEAPGSANIGSVFNAAQTSRAELRLNGLLVLKGVFRITNIIKDKDMIEYEGNLFGELGGFIAAIGAGKLEDLDFSVYNHIYNRGNIVNSWDNKIIKDVRVNFIKTGNINTIIIQNGIDLGLKINDLITVTNAIYNQNNGTFTVIQYVPPSATSNAIIYISESLANTNTVNDDITIEYTRSFGSGYYYPLIDYGTYSSNKINYDYRTFRPALYVKEYLDKIFEGSGYTYESSFLNSDFFKKLIIPNNSKQLKGFFTDLLDVKTSLSLTNSSSIITETLQFNTENLKRSFTGNGNPDYTYTGSNESLNLNYKLIGVFGIFSSQAFFKFSIIKNTTIIKTYSYFNRDLINQINIIDNINLDVATNDKLIFEIQYQYLNGARIDFQYLKIKANNPISTDVQLGNNILINDIIPRNILQKDFFTWIMKMFNLYITEDKLREKHLLIEPYTDYWNLDNPIDWTYKVARDKAWNIKPMGMLNGRFFEYKYKDDNDFYNEGFKKKYNLPYGSILEDTKFQFAKEKQTIEIGFSPSVLIQYQGTDKVVTAIYKKSSGNSVDQEERMDSNIRILMAKKMTGVTSWYIRNNDANANLGAALTTDA
jgi:hypothetical protein